jgi:hypothetical protein
MRKKWCPVMTIKPGNLKTGNTGTLQSWFEALTSSLASTITTFEHH